MVVMIRSFHGKANQGNPLMNLDMIIIVNIYMVKCFDDVLGFHASMPLVVHAVVNAIINRTTPSLEGCTIYVTLKPDRDCAHAIVQAGISTVKYGKFIRPGRESKSDIIDGDEILHHGDVNLV